MGEKTSVVMHLVVGITKILLSESNLECYHSAFMFTVVFWWTDCQSTLVSLSHGGLS